MLSCVQLFMTAWTVAHQAPLSMRFSRKEYWSGLPFPIPGYLPEPGIKSTFLVWKEYWSGLPFPTPGYLPEPGIKPTFLVSSALVGRSFTNVLCGILTYNSKKEKSVRKSGMIEGLHRKGEINYIPEKAESRYLKEQGSHSRQETAPARANSHPDPLFHQPLTGSKLVNHLLKVTDS